MTLEDLRHREDEIRASLATVREKLEAAVAAIERAESAREQAAAAKLTKSEGAYREIAREHASELESLVSGARLAAEQRERFRHEERQLLGELEKVRVEMESLGVRRNVLPILDGVPAAAPCSMRWDDMSGNGDARTCPRCKLMVVNLAMVDAARAQELISACGRDLDLHRRSDGTVLASDCPAGVERRRFFSVAPLAILALLAAIGGFALLGPRERHFVRQPSTPDIGQISLTDRPPSLEPGQFGSTPPIDPPPQVPTKPLPPLRGAPSLHVSDGFSGVRGAETTRVTLTRNGDKFDVKTTCANRLAHASYAATIPATTVDAFLTTVAAHQPTVAREAKCNHFDDHPYIDVTIDSTPPVTLSVTNCSYQWHADGVPLDDTAPAQPGRRESAHFDINDAYRALLAAAGERKCLDDLDKQKPPRTDGQPRGGNCDPPYVVDGSGHKVWKRECF